LFVPTPHNHTSLALTPKITQQKSAKNTKMSVTLTPTKCLEEIAAISSTTLLDINWSVRLVTASSKVSSLQQPIVLLQLRLLDKSCNDDEQAKWITVELNEDELNSFVEKLKQMKNLMWALEKK
jgi:hypothetical protein